MQPYKSDLLILNDHCCNTAKTTLELGNLVFQTNLRCWIRLYRNVNYLRSYLQKIILIFCYSYSCPERVPQLEIASLLYRIVVSRTSWALKKTAETLGPDVLWCSWFHIFKTEGNNILWVKSILLDRIIDLINCSTVTSSVLRDETWQNAAASSIVYKYKKINKKRRNGWKYKKMDSLDSPTVQLWHEAENILCFNVCH